MSAGDQAPAKPVTPDDVVAAYTRIKDSIHKTPVMLCDGLSSMAN